MNFMRCKHVYVVSIVWNNFLFNVRTTSLCRDWLYPKIPLTKRKDWRHWHALILNQMTISTGKTRPCSLILKQPCLATFVPQHCIKLKYSQSLTLKEKTDFNFLKSKDSFRVQGSYINLRSIVYFWLHFCLFLVSLLKTAYCGGDTTILMLWARDQSNLRPLFSWGGSREIFFSLSYYSKK